MPSCKSVELIRPLPSPHWVGDGFLVRSVIAPGPVSSRLNPFILFDYAQPTRFDPSVTPRGVDTHPHRGFETVTIVYQGELEHRDSTGNSGRIGPGEVQWMTAASGILHEEKHSDDFTRRGGILEMAQLWVNLPASHKMDPPRYQALRRETIPTVSLPDDAGTLSLIAGAWNDVAGAAETVTPVTLWDVHLRKDRETELPIQDLDNAGIFLRSGRLTICEADDLEAHQLAVLSSTGTGAKVRALEEARFILFGGTPIDEPIVSHGPFVMNTQAEIQTAFEDLRAGRFGSL